MNSPQVVVSKAFREYFEVATDTCGPMPQNCVGTLRWRAEIVDDDADEILALFTNEPSLYSIIISEDDLRSEEPCLAAFHGIFEQTVKEVLSGSEVHFDAPVPCVRAAQSLIASMNYLRQLIEELRLDGRSYHGINHWPLKAIEYHTPEERFRELLNVQWG